MMIDYLSVDKDVLTKLNKSVDEIINLSLTYLEVKDLVNKFQEEQNTDMKVFRSHSSDKVSHFKRTLERMIDLSVSLFAQCLRRTLEDATQVGEQDTVMCTTTAQVKSGSQKTVNLYSPSWRQYNATVSFLCTNVLSLCILASMDLREEMQVYIINCRTLEHICEALNISRDHEINYFIEGHKTELVRLLANLCYNNKEVSSAICSNTDLLVCILSSTQVDEENPGIGEWAKLAIRNLCELSDEGREKIKGLKAISLTDESKKLLMKQGYSFDRSLIKLKKCAGCDNEGVDQEAVLSEWRNKAIESEGHFCTLWARAQSEKEKTKARNRKAKWIQDLNALHKDEEKCLKSLTSLSKDINDFAEVHKSLSQYLLQELKEIDFLAAKNSKANVTVLKNKIEKFQKFLEDANKEVEADLAGSFEISIFFHVQDGILAAFLKAKEAIEKHFAPNNTEHFLKALSLEKEEVFSQLQDLKFSFTSNPHVLLSAQCLIEINNDSRKHTFESYSTKVLTDRLHNIFPDLSFKELSYAIEEALLLKRQTTRLKNLLRYVKNVTDDIVTSHDVVIHGKAWSTELQKLIHLEEDRIIEARNSLNSKLEIQRKIFCEKKARLELEKKAAEEELARQKAVQSQQRMKEFFSRLKLLEEYEKRKNEAKEKEKEIELIREKEELEKKQHRIAENSKRVAYRHQRLLERKREHEEAVQELEIIRKRKENAILRFLHSVQEKIGVETSFERVLQSTKSSEKSEVYVTSAQIREGNMFGYSDEKIMRDPRVRLYHALLGAGLHKTEYGREKITEGYRVPSSMQVSEGNPFAGSFS